MKAKQSVTIIYVQCTQRVMFALLVLPPLNKAWEHALKLVFQYPFPGEFSNFFVGLTYQTKAEQSLTYKPLAPVVCQRRMFALRR